MTYLFSLTLVWVLMCSLCTRNSSKWRINQENCVSSVLQRRHLFLVKEVTLLPRHSSLRSILCVPRNSSSLYFTSLSYRVHFQPLFLYGPVILRYVLCDPFHWAHHGNLVRPGKNAPQRTQGHILHKRAKASGSVFFQQLLADRAHAAQDWVCVAETAAFYRLGDENDWVANASSLTVSCTEAPVP